MLRHQRRQQQSHDADDIAIVPRCILPLLHAADTASRWVDRHACAFDAFMATLRSHLPATVRAVVDQVTVIVVAHALAGLIGTVLLATARVAVRWLSWWVLP